MLLRQWHWQLWSTVLTHPHCRCITELPCNSAAVRILILKSVQVSILHEVYSTQRFLLLPAWQGCYTTVQQNLLPEGELSHSDNPPQKT